MTKIIPYIKTEDFRVVPAGALELSLSYKNWEKDYPTETKTSGMLWHDSDNLYINYLVDEKNVVATIDSDNGKVSRDSCVEAFLSFDSNGYYNIEANCIGKVLLSHRKSRKENVTYATQEVLDKIERSASLGNEPFSCRESKGQWSLTLKLPKEIFFKNEIKDLSDLEIKANFYKCGDLLPNPHFLSWQPVATPDPDFHRPEFFATLRLE